MRIMLVGVNLSRKGGVGYSLANEYLKVSLQNDPEIGRCTEVRTINYDSREFEQLRAPAVDAFYDLLNDFYLDTPDVIGFSCYIWNIQQIKSLTTMIKQVLPDVRIVFGGPEFDSIRQAEYQLAQAPDVDFIVRGEGEFTFRELVRTMDWKDRSADEILGLTYRTKGSVRSTPDRPPIADLNSIPPPYLQSGQFDFRPFRQPQSTLLLETYRGCINRCAYCNWSDKTMRSFSLERVKAEIKKIIDEKVHNVYIIDSHFGMNLAFSKEIMRFIAAENTGTEFDVYPYMSYDDEEYFELLKEANIKVIGFGVQTTNPLALRKLRRPWNRELFEKNLRRIRDLQIPFRNVDLVLGLPGDTYDGFEQSVRYCLDLAPQFIHIHPLKVIPGSPFFENKDSEGIKCSPVPPYHILSNPSFPFQDVIRAKALACAVAAFYHHFPNTLRRTSVLTGKTQLEILKQFGLWACLDKRELSLSSYHPLEGPSEPEENRYYPPIIGFIENTILEENVRLYLTEFLECEHLSPRTQESEGDFSVVEITAENMLNAQFRKSNNITIRRFHFDFNLPVDSTESALNKGEFYYIFTKTHFLSATPELICLIEDLTKPRAYGYVIGRHFPGYIHDRLLQVVDILKQLVQCGVIEAR